MGIRYLTAQTEELMNPIVHLGKPMQSLSIILSEHDSRHAQRSQFERGAVTCEEIAISASRI